MCILKARYKYYIGTYILGYIVALIGTGVPNVYYLIPFKVIAIIITLSLGNGFYYIIEEKLNRSEATFRSIKYLILGIGILILFGFIQQYLLSEYSIDIMPFLGLKLD